MFGWLNDAISGSPVTYLIVFGVAALDAVFPLVPSETVVIAAAVVAAKGGLSIWLIIPAAALGGFLGDNTSYLLGDRIGEPVARKLFHGDTGKQRLERAEQMLHRHGRLLVIAGRFIPGGRTATTFAAGTLDMSWRTFAPADALAAVAWALYAGMLGYLGGSTFSSSEWKSLALAFGIAAAITLSLEGVRRIQKRRGKDILGADESDDGEAGRGGESEDDDERRNGGRPGAVRAPQRPGRAREAGRTLTRLVHRSVDVGVERFARNDILTYASAIAFQLLVALVPLGLLVLVGLGYTGLGHLWGQDVAPAVARKLTGPAAHGIRYTVDAVVRGHRLSWLVAACLITLWEVSGSVRAVMGALNRIHGHEEERSIWHRFALSFALAIAVSVLVIGSLLAAALGPRGVGIDLPGPVDQVVRWTLAVMLLWAVIALLFRLAPCGRRPVRWVGLGSVLVIAVWIGASLLFRLYVFDVASYRSGFGAMTAVLTLTGYLYTTSIILLAGAQLDQVLEEQAARDEPGPFDGVLSSAPERPVRRREHARV